MSETDPRRVRRARVLKGGIIAFGERHLTLPCTVRDLSETGARLRVASALAVPDRFELLIDLDGMEAWCTVAWRRGDEVGISFEAPPRVTAPKRAQVVSAVRPDARPSLRRVRST